MWVKEQQYPSLRQKYPCTPVYRFKVFYFLFSPQLHLNYQNESSYSLNVYSNDDGSSGYFSPSLQEDVFQQVQSVQDSMLLHGVDPNQLAESIQVGQVFWFTINILICFLYINMPGSSFILVVWKVKGEWVLYEYLL